MDPEIILRGKGFRIVVPLGDGAAMPTAGGPNVEELARPEKPALTQVSGQVLKRVDVPVFWDGWRQRRNVWPDVMQVVGLCLELPLPDFTVEGPVPFSGERFLMEWPEWVRLDKSAGGAVLQAELVLKLVEFNDPNAIHERRKGHGGKGGGANGGTTAPATITLKQPETLIEVAAHFMGDPGKAQAIGKLNGIHDIKKKLDKGTRLKLPGG
jgi:hypothetical protein